MRLAGLLQAFRQRRPDREALARVKAWSAAALDRPGTAFAVNEVVCADPTCPGFETVILIMEPGRKTRGIRIGKPLDEVTEQDIRDAFV